MESVRRARARVQRYPQFLMECTSSATAYAKCVLAQSNLGLKNCEDSYRAFELCLQDAAKKSKMRL